LFFNNDQKAFIARAGVGDPTRRIASQRVWGPRVASQPRGLSDVDRWEDFGVLDVQNSTVSSQFQTRTRKQKHTLEVRYIDVLPSRSYSTY